MHPLPIGPALQADATSGVFGNVDSVNGRGLFGWIVDLAAVDAVLPLEVRINGIAVANIHNDEPRDDIAKAVGRSFTCGFALPWEDEALCEHVLGPKAHQLEAGDVMRFEVYSVRHGAPIGAAAVEVAAHQVRDWTRQSVLRSQRVDAPGSARNRITPSRVVEHFARAGVGEAPGTPTSDVRLIAYYLPQYHPVPENDEWWGKGFTEWTNVTRARPYFDGHYQPQLPSELGFYDLRLPEVREAQAKLAREHGIHGFCYYYYWFAGRRLLEFPLQQVLESGKPDFPFCICWANENWSRRWDGSEHEVLVEQIHNDETDVAFIKDVIPLFKDPRYIRVGGAPLLVIYRLSLMPNPLKTAIRWREVCAAHGIPDIHLCMAETFALSDPIQYGFNSAVQFPPHGVMAPVENENIATLEPGFEGNIHDTRSVVADQINRVAPVYKRFPGVMTSWDNTPRKKKSGNVFINSTPDTYELWLRNAIDQARQRLPEGERLVFINAWNEWAEGAHLEPDQRHGRAYLEATRRALTGAMPWQQVIEYGRSLDRLEGGIKDWVLGSLRAHLDKRDIVNRHLLAQTGKEAALPFQVRARPGVPHWMADLPVSEGGHSSVEQINWYHYPVPGRIAASTWQKLLVSGWACCPPLPLQRDTIGYLVFESLTEPGRRFFAILPERAERTDVRDGLSLLPPQTTLYTGFRYYIDVSDVAAGTYALKVAQRGEGRTWLIPLNQEIEFE